MNVYNVEIKGVEFSNESYKILAEDMTKAMQIAGQMLKSAKDNLPWEDIELVEVSLSDNITDPAEFNKERIEQGEKARKEAEEIEKEA